MKRWLLWFLLAPQTFLLAGVLCDLGVGHFEFGACACLHLAWFADRRALPWLLLGFAIGRGLVDEASLPVQILVLGVPAGVLLPLRAMVPPRWSLQCVAAGLCALVIPRLAALCGALFDQPAGPAAFDWAAVARSVVYVPLLLAALRVLPPLRAFEERA